MSEKRNTSMRRMRKAEREARKACNALTDKSLRGIVWERVYRDVLERLAEPIRWRDRGERWQVLHGRAEGPRARAAVASGR